MNIITYKKHRQRRCLDNEVVTKEIADWSISSISSLTDDKCQFTADYEDVKLKVILLTQSIENSNYENNNVIECLMFLLEEITDQIMRIFLRAMDKSKKIFDFLSSVVLNIANIPRVDCISDKSENIFIKLLLVSAIYHQLSLDQEHLIDFYQKNTIEALGVLIKYPFRSFDFIKNQTDDKYETVETDDKCETVNLFETVIKIEKLTINTWISRYGHNFKIQKIINQRSIGYENNFLIINNNISFYDRIKDILKLETVFRPLYNNETVTGNNDTVETVTGILPPVEISPQSLALNSLHIILYFKSNQRSIDSIDSNQYYIYILDILFDIYLINSNYVTEKKINNYYKNETDVRLIAVSLTRLSSILQLLIKLGSLLFLVPPGSHLAPLGSHLAPLGSHLVPPGSHLVHPGSHLIIKIPIIFASVSKFITNNKFEKNKLTFDWYYFLFQLSLKFYNIWTDQSNVSLNETSDNGIIISLILPISSVKNTALWEFTDILKNISKNNIIQYWDKNIIGK
eukprot:GHVL01014347.1.p1 GENE.GHVL01014347.1~~GHVL01014347.1.p1  ORF type:complete len:515 (-),score=170.41 GHVL01014347.1:819-2363(-)